MKNVVVYTSDTCPYCNEAKAYLASKEINFIEKNIKDSDARKELISMGIRSVPVIIIDEEKIIGFDVEKINSLL